MGGISRMTRADAFVKEFAEDLIKAVGWDFGPRQLSVGMSQEESNDMVKMWVRLTDGAGVEHEMTDGFAWFDPENEPNHETVERLFLADIIPVPVKFRDDKKAYEKYAKGIITERLNRAFPR